MQRNRRLIESASRDVDRTRDTLEGMPFSLDWDRFHVDASSNWYLILRDQVDSLRPGHTMMHDIKYPYLRRQMITGVSPQLEAGHTQRTIYIPSIASRSIEAARGAAHRTRISTVIRSRQLGEVGTRCLRGWRSFTGRCCRRYSVLSPQGHICQLQLLARSYEVRR